MKINFKKTFSAVILSSLLMGALPLTGVQAAHKGKWFHNEGTRFFESTHYYSEDYEDYEDSEASGAVGVEVALSHEGRCSLVPLRIFGKDGYTIITCENCEYSFEEFRSKDKLNWEIGSGENLLIFTNAIPKEVQEIYIDKKRVKRSYYEVDEDKGVIAISADFLRKLDTGRHSLFVDYKEAFLRTSIEITKPRFDAIDALRLVRDYCKQHNKENNRKNAKE